MVQNIFKSLEFNEIKMQIDKYLETTGGHHILNNLHPINKLNIIKQWINETDDGLNIIKLKGKIPVGSLDNIYLLLKRLSVKSQLNCSDFLNLDNFMQSTINVISFFKNLKNDGIKLNSLYELSDKLISVTSLHEKILMTFDNDGNIKDNASSNLQKIRVNLRRTNKSIHEILNNYIHGTSSKYLSNSVITIRDNRYVIPVKVEYRKYFGGMVHDRSSSGQTLFIEPQKVVSLNNDYQIYEKEEKIEITNILNHLVEYFMPFVHNMFLNLKILNKLDFINAKSLYAKYLDATKPFFNSNNNVNLKQAWHPLLSKNSVIKNDIYIGKKFKTMIITGPNTGGKTITLKTLGIIQMMAQSGLFIPAEENSYVGIFDNIYTDIGDEQSIEQNLSTFSAHIKNVISILDKITNRSLILLDELGAGTNPQEGASLAISILDRIQKIGSYTLVTTHYPELMIYAYNNSDTINSSVEFDSLTLKPTYKLLIGVPGNSSAFNISERLGLDKNIVNEAKSIMDNKDKNLNETVTGLYDELNKVQKEKEILDEQFNEIKNKKKQLQNQINLLNNSKDNEILNAKQRANLIVENTLNKCKKIVSKLRNLEKKGFNFNENELISNLHNIKKLKYDIKKVKNYNNEDQIFKAGDKVKLLNYDNFGILKNKTGKNNWNVQIGNLHVIVSEKEIKKVNVSLKDHNSSESNIFINKTRTISNKLDLRGQSYVDAIKNLDRYIDSALLNGYHIVTIIHGIGTGTIRNAVQDYLKKSPNVVRYYYAKPNEGGTGVTIVELN